jgi:hypothetical protein
MIVTFFDREHNGSDLDGVVIRNTAQLFQLLESFASRVPFICELVGENGYDLLVGVGTKGFVQYSRTDGDPPYLVAVAPDAAGREEHEDEIEFVMGGTATPIPFRNCMPFHNVREIAGYFLETGLIHPAFVWEQV